MIKNLVILFVVLAGGFLSTPAIARNFHVAIAVDEVASTALKARETAFAKSEKKAFWKLLKRITPTKAADIQDSMTAERLHDLVKDFKITDEKITAGRYRATITYYFYSDRVLRLTYDAKGLSANSGTGTLLILPVLDNGASLLLWENNNAWRKIFNEVSLGKGRGKLIMPYGDPKDKMAINQEILLSGDRASLQGISQRYGTRNVLIVLAKPRIVDGVMKMKVMLRRAGATKEEASFHYIGTSGETVKDVMERAATDIAGKLSNIADRHKIFNNNSKSGAKTIVIRVEFSTVREWMKIRELLQSLPSIQYFEEGAITIDYATATLYYKGQLSMIKRGLLSKGLKTTEKRNYWVISQ